MLLIKSYRHVGVPPPVYPGGSAQRVENLGGERACYDVRGDDRNSGGGRRLRRRSVPRNPAHRARPLSPRSTPRIAAHTVTVAAGSAPRSSTRRRSLPHRRRSPLPAPPPSPFARARRRSSLCGGPAREWRRRPPRRRRPPPSFPVPSALRPRYRLAHAHAPIQTTARPKKTPSGGLKVVSRRVQRTSRCRSAVRGSRKPTKKNQGVQQLPHPRDARA